MVTYGTIVPVQRFSTRDLKDLTGVNVRDLSGWRSGIASNSAAISRTYEPTPHNQLPSTEHVPLPRTTLSRTELDVLLAQQTPYRIAAMAARRLERQREREAERARIAGQLLRANLSTPGKRFSMADAALARVATSGSDEDAVVFVDKRRLRGDTRAAEYARLKQREQLPPSTLGKVRGNGKAKRPKGAGRGW